MSTVNNGKQNLSVVVWEWENKQGRWRPYTPEVTQHLERTYFKNLKSVMLGDADHVLNNYSVNLSQMKQICNDTGTSVNIRRSLYPQSSPAGQGADWQWAGENPGDWHTYDMCVQCVLESAWASGLETIDMDETFPLCPYVINFCNLIQTNKNTGYTRMIRRKTQASYPIGRPVTPQQNSYSAGGSNHGASTSGIFSKPSTQDPPAELDKQKRRESREEKLIDVRHKSESHARHLFNKVLNLAGGSSCSSGSEGSHIKASGASLPSSSKATKQDYAVASSSAATPLPYPRSAVPPVPKPRTLFPDGQSRVLTNPSANQLQDRWPSRDYFLKQSMEEDTHNNHSDDMSQEKYGSNATLNSDCSSLAGARRPSLETISTYLSQDSFSEELQGQSSQITPQASSSDLRMDTLVHLDDSMDEDEVFSEDREVQDVMMKSRRNHKSNFPPIPPNHVMVGSNASKSHFVPISSPVGSEATVLNGVKRKRPNDHSQPQSASSSSSSDHHQTASRMELRSGRGRAENGFKHSAFRPPDANQTYYYNDKDTKNNNNNSNNNFNHRKAVLRKPKTDKEKLLTQYTKPVVQPSNDDCSICMCPLTEDSTYEASGSGYLVGAAVSLSNCGHSFHEECLCRLLENCPHPFLQCPNCKKLHGEKWGNQPKGKMSVDRIPRPLPGYSECGTIRITYTIFPGYQGPEHPNPGKMYKPIGFPRVAFLPDNEKGNRVLRLLRVAFNRRLTFTVGTSVTTGLGDAVTWNEIHHKTEWFNNSGHGYPDPGYLDNVLEELEAQGVIE